MEKINKVNVVGGGLAGVETCYQLLRRGIAVDLYEMRPVQMTEAHQTGDLAELVCSNSFKSQEPTSTSGLLKAEMATLDSLVVQKARESSVPAGGALAVDRKSFSDGVFKALQSFENFRRVDKTITEIPDPVQCHSAGELWIIATGPLTAEPLMQHLYSLCGEKSDLHFYDAIAPIIETDSIDKDHGFWANRWKEEEEGDYFNIPLEKDEYQNLIAEIRAAEKTPLHDFEKTRYFEACLPIEVMAERGEDTLRFGPFKPTGLKNPKTGKGAYAVIQLRKENAEGSMLSMVGCQTKMKWPEQKRVFNQIPALKDAVFYRYGSVHRNSYLNSPRVLQEDLRFRKHPYVYLAGQITGVEGYTESAAIGLLAGRFAASRIFDEPLPKLPQGCMLYGLWNYVTMGVNGPFQPMNAHFGLLPQVTDLSRKKLGKKRIQQIRCERALEKMQSWSAEH